MAKNNEQKDETPKDEREASRSDEHRKHGKCNCRCRKRGCFGGCFLFIRRWVKYHASRQNIVVYAFYNLLCCIAAIVIGVVWQSFLDVGIPKFNQLWLYILLWALAMVICILGCVAAGTRSPKLIRIYVVSMPCILFLTVGNTVTLFRLRCDCRNFFQCSALRSFAAQEYVVPFPVPPGAGKFHFDGEQFPFKVLPGSSKYQEVTGSADDDSGLRDFSSLEVISWEQRHHENNNQKNIWRPSGRIAKIGKVLPHREPLGRDHDIDETMYLLKRANADSSKLQGPMNETTSPGPTVNVKAEQSLFKTQGLEPRGGRNSSNCEMPESNVRTLLLGNFKQNTASIDRRSLASMNDGSNVSIRRHTVMVGSPLPAVTKTATAGPGSTVSSGPPRRSRLPATRGQDMRKLYVFQALKYEYEHQPEPGSSVEPPTCKKFSLKNKKFNEFRQKILRCRRDFAKEESTRCNRQVERHLEKCVKDESCGGVKIMMEKTYQQENMWSLQVCFLSAPLHHIPHHYVMDKDDEDAAWDDADPLVLYFARDMTQTLRDGQRSFGQMVEPKAQAEMTWDKHLYYLEMLRDSGCYCKNYRSCAATSASDGKSVSYSAYSHNGVTGQLTYWCTVDAHHVDPCRQGQLPGVPTKAKIELHRMPGDDKDYWTRDICSKTEEGESQVGVIRSNKKSESKRVVGRCQCMKDTGFKVRGQDLASLAPDIIKNADNQEEPLIGYRCKRWYKTDRLPWCVVGFDSACADKKTQSISVGKKLRMFTSSIPCQKEELPHILESAAENCKALLVMWMVCDLPRYILFPLSLAFACYFAQARCQDAGRTANYVDRWRFEDDMQADDEDQFENDYDSDDSESSYDSWNSDEDAHAKDEKKAKAKHDKEKLKKRETAQSDEDWDVDPEPEKEKKTKGRKKKRKDNRGNSPSRSGDSGGTG
eukprot:gnl/MRDRNA2_/MRDRNA2_48989_c0_seq1.p1 gnl/MRDRNA2_/MRDRNA2_48989_c0~~gnl/MRDRNA2_/MRDRNA2_48989_c0_seq1.p1  ORF type:complete len:931 (+),score=134.92 gnl/MRDRNA2_/MRDRNA2_48989_c0_seq1:122-2914(+)